MAKGNNHELLSQQNRGVQAPQRPSGPMGSTGTPGGHGDGCTSLDNKDERTQRNKENKNWSLVGNLKRVSKNDINTILNQGQFCDKGVVNN